MSVPDDKKSSEVICDCSGTTIAKILELMDKGVDNIDRIADITGAFTGCGGCEDKILKLLEKKS